MNFFKKFARNEALESEVNNLKYKIKELEAKIKRIESFDNWTDICSVDFREMNVVSVERVYDYERDIPKTVLGYRLTDTKKDEKSDKLREWNLFITADEHKKLIDLFEAYKDTKW